WEVGSWQQKLSIPHENTGRSIGWVAFSPDRKMVAVPHSMTEVHLVDSATGHTFARLPTSGTPYCFSPDGSQLVTYAGRDGADRPLQAASSRRVSRPRAPSVLREHLRSPPTAPSESRRDRRIGPPCPRISGDRYPGAAHVTPSILMIRAILF